MNWHALYPSEALNKLKTDAGGLKNSEIEQRRRESGSNVIPEPPRSNIFIRFFSQFTDFLILLLLAAAAVSFVTSLLQGYTDIVDPVIILIIVFLNALIGLIQENKAEKALSELRKMTGPRACVLRDGIKADVLASEVVTGDIILLKQGDFVPADAYILESVPAFRRVGADRRIP